MARSAPITGITDSELYTDVRSAMERLAACRQSFADAAGKLAQLLTPEHIQEVTRVSYGGGLAIYKDPHRYLGNPVQPITWFPGVMIT